MKCIIVTRSGVADAYNIDLPNGDRGRVEQDRSAEVLRPTTIYGFHVHRKASACVVCCNGCLVKRDHPERGCDEHPKQERPYVSYTSVRRVPRDVKRTLEETLSLMAPGVPLELGPDGRVLVHKYMDYDAKTIQAYPRVANDVD